MTHPLAPANISIPAINHTVQYFHKDASRDKTEPLQEKHPAFILGEFAANAASQIANLAEYSVNKASKIATALRQLLIDFDKAIGLPCASAQELNPTHAMIFEDSFYDIINRQALVYVCVEEYISIQDLVILKFKEACQEVIKRDGDYGLKMISYALKNIDTLTLKPAEPCASNPDFIGLGYFNPTLNEISISYFPEKIFDPDYKIDPNLLRHEIAHFILMSGRKSLSPIYIDHCYEIIKQKQQNHQHCAQDFTTAYEEFSEPNPTTLIKEGCKDYDERLMRINNRRSIEEECQRDVVCSSLEEDAVLLAIEQEALENACGPKQFYEWGKLFSGLFDRRSPITAITQGALNRLGQDPENKKVIEDFKFENLKAKTMKLNIFTQTENNRGR